jgi:hypothetical protein
MQNPYPSEFDRGILMTMLAGLNFPTLLTMTSCSTTAKKRAPTVMTSVPSKFRGKLVEREPSIVKANAKIAQ